MSTLFKKLTSTKKRHAAIADNSGIQTQCNYADNYYGDQICVAVKPIKPRINFHVGVQM
jgi:hypothetical protein